MYIGNRPPVTNLYSSAVFIGWGGLALCLILERIYKLGIGSFVGAALAFCTMLIARFLAESERAEVAAGVSFDAEAALEAGLVTFAPDEIDWEDEVRLALEERASLSPDALTGMEANLRFAGPETMETKIFGRLSAWQNWIFQRPNAVGEKGALTLYGKPERARFTWSRT